MQLLFLKGEFGLPPLPPLPPKTGRVAKLWLKSLLGKNRGIESDFLFVSEFGETRMDLSNSSIHTRPWH